MFRVSKITVIFILIISVFSIALETFAVDSKQVDTSKSTSITVNFSPNNIQAKNVGFKIYKVADVTSDFEFILTKEFENYSISLEGIDQDGWRKLAGTLAPYAINDSIKPIKENKTNWEGKASFNNLEVGLYLVVGDKYYYEDYIYTPLPFFICLPTYDSNNKLKYNIDSVVKHESKHIEDTDEKTISRKVIIVWDDENKDNRPLGITLCLYRDGEVYDTVVLNSENNWKHVWYELDSNYSWYIKEKDTTDKYTSSVITEGVTFVITKTYVESEGEGNITKPDDDTPKLPTTGVLWWPVPYLAITGIILFLIGWVIQKGEENEK